MKSIVCAAVILFASCGSQPLPVGAPVYSYSLFNTLGGEFDVLFINELGDAQTDRVMSGWLYEFQSEQKYFALRAYGLKQGDTEAEFRENGILIKRSQCLCSFPILELEVFLE